MRFLMTYDSTPVQEQYCGESTHRWPVTLKVTAIEGEKVHLSAVWCGKRTAPWGWMVEGYMAPIPLEKLTGTYYTCDERKFAVGELIHAEYRDGFGVDGCVVFDRV